MIVDGRTEFVDSNNQLALEAIEKTARQPNGFAYARASRLPFHNSVVRL